MKLTVGDIVQLKSGGPLMTIVELDGRIAKCIHYSATREIFRDLHVSVEALALHEEEAINPDR